MNSHTPPELLFLVAYYISMNTMKINTFHVLFIITKPPNWELNLKFKSDQESNQCCLTATPATICRRSHCLIQFLAFYIFLLWPPQTAGAEGEQGNVVYNFLFSVSRHLDGSWHKVLLCSKVLAVFLEHQDMGIHPFQTKLRAGVPLQAALL